MSESQPFAALLQRVRPEVDRALSDGWALAWQEHAGLGAAVSAPLAAARELCLRGGKRLRAALVAAGHQIAGGGTELGRIGTALRTIEPERTALQREVDRLVTVIAVLGLAAAAAVVVVYGLTRGDWLEGKMMGR